MVQAEASVTSTAVTAITNDLGNFEKNAWIFSAYLLTYSGKSVVLLLSSCSVGEIAPALLSELFDAH